MKNCIQNSRLHLSKDFLPVDSFGQYSQLVIFYFTAPRPSADILNIDLFHIASDNGLKVNEKLVFWR